MATLDAELELLLARKEFFERNPSAGQLEVGPDELIRISVAFSGDIAALEQAGLKVGSASGRIAYGATTVAGLKVLAALPQVQSIHRQRFPYPHLNRSVPDIKADQVWGRSGDNFNGYTGRGVLVGIIDTGIDITHDNFRKPDGSTRIVGIWDQTLVAQGGETVPGPMTDTNITLGGSNPTPLGYGVEYDQSQINDTVQNKNPAVKVRHIDEDGHGTHVAGIAAGDGSQRGGCLVKYQYVGVAPEADIIVVRLFGLSKSDKKLAAPSSSNVQQDAIRYILNQAIQRTQPAVINLSLGLLTEFMDGTSAECKDIDALLLANTKGRAIVFSAGNDGDENFHATATVPAGPAASLALNFKIYGDDTAKPSRTLMVMYSGSNLQAQLTSPVAGAGGIIPWVSSGSSNTSNTANGSNGSVTITNAVNRITISISSTPVSPAATPPKYNPRVAGTWKLELRDTGNTATKIDAYCLYGSSHDDKSSWFLSNASSRSTLSETATCHEALAVGSCRVGGALSTFSSRGPTLDAPGRTKPELCAPGDNVTSAHSSTISDDPDCFICCCACCEAYVDKGGTSMAAPHITGVIALMLHKDPNLKHDEIATILTANAAAKPSGTPSDDDPGWGAGRADAKQTLDSDSVEEVNPPVAVHAADPQTVPQILAQVDPILAARDTLLATERGAEFFRLFERHAREVRTLINANRRVATAWHRCKGPVWVRMSLRAVHSPDLPLPTQIEDLTLQEAIQQFARVMLRYASAQLCRDVQTYLPQLPTLVDGMSLSEFIKVLGAPSEVNNGTQSYAPA